MFRIGTVFDVYIDIKFLQISHLSCFFVFFIMRVHFSTALSQAHLTFAAFEAFMVFTAPKGKGSKKGK